MVTYLTERIKDELEDAKQYAVKALEEKQDNCNIAMLLMKLSDDELNHAQMLTKMLNTMKTDSKDGDGINSVLKRFSEVMADISAVKKLYRL